jgi:hypothetical protein
MTERELTAYAAQINDELMNTRMDYRLLDRHFDILTDIRIEIKARRAAA